MDLNPFTDTIQRLFGKTTDDQRLLELIAYADSTVKREYNTGRRSLRMHVPEEDNSFQQSKRGAQWRDNPILVGILKPDGKNIYIPTPEGLLNYQFNIGFVIPLFTSENRLHQFLKYVSEVGCKVPEHQICLFKYNMHVKNMINNGEVVINPIPEFMLTAFFVINFQNEEWPLTMVIPDGLPITGKDNEKGSISDQINGLFSKRI